MPDLTATESPIFAVDGDGPSFFDKQEASEGDSGAEETEPNAETEGDAGGESEAAAETAEAGEGEKAESAAGASKEKADPDLTAGDVTGFDSDLEAAFAPPSEAEAEAEETPEELKGLESSSARVQKRIRGLVDSRKAVEQKAVTLQQQWQQWGDEANQTNQRLQHDNRQLHTHVQQHQVELAELRAQISTIRDYAPKPEADAADTFRSELTAETARQVQGLLAPELKQHREKMQAYESDRKKEAADLKERQTAFASQQRQQAFSTEATSAADSIMLDGFPEEFKSELSGPMSGLVLAWAHGRRMKIPDAARDLKPILLRHGLGQLRAHAASKGQKLQTSQNTTSPPRAARAHGSGSAVPSHKAAIAQGHQDELGAMFARDGLIG